MNYRVAFRPSQLRLCQNFYPSMPLPKQMRRGLIASVLLCAALNSAALTLGRSQGVALIGRTLDVVIPVTLDSPGQVSDLCTAADVFHGDSRVEPARVTARLEPVSGQQAVIRVRSSQPVDEPVVTLYLRLGCNEQMTRRYVLLSEPQSAGVPALPAAAAAAPAAERPQPATAQGGRTAGPDRAAPPPSGRPGRAAAPAAPAAASQRAAAARAERSLPSRSSRRQPAVSRGASRLQLDLLDLAPERDPVLKASSGLSGEPSTSEQVRLEAAALWRAINAQPQDVLRDFQRVQALESDVKGLRELVTGNQRTLNDLRGQLDEANQERAWTLWAIALLALLLMAMVVTWWLRRGDRASYGGWWRQRGRVGGGSATDGDSVLQAVDRDLRVDESMFESLWAEPRPVAVPVAAAAPLPRPTVASPAGPVSSFHSGFPASQSGTRMVKAEELVDVQQQAHFFLSLGQTDQAIEVLESHIQNSVETSALVWLDLLAIYRSLKRPQEYEQLRAHFQRVFNAEVPSYDSTPTVSGGLEDYPRALSRIAALWPSPKVMDVIEEAIFRKPGLAEGKPFDLEAYRELVMLYNLGRDVVQPETIAGQEQLLPDAPASSFFATAMQPLSISPDSRLAGVADRATLEENTDVIDITNVGELAALSDMGLNVDSMLLDEEGPDTRLGELPDPRMPRPSPRLGLDIDLTGPPPGAKGQPAVDSSSVDFELSVPGEEAAGKPHSD